MPLITFMKKALVKVMKHDFQKIIQEFFIKYLNNERGTSENTIRNYRDTFVLLLEYIKKEKNTEIHKIRLEDVDHLLVTDFLDWLEKEKKVSISTRNNRLAGIRSFFKYLCNHYPMYLYQSTMILEIKAKNNQARPMNYLTVEAVKHLFSTFPKNNHKELRNLCIVLLLYESGARVSELINIRTYELKLSPPHTLVLHGKGNKTRIIPIDKAVVDHIKEYINIYDIKNEDYLFKNNRNEQLTRKGITYILQKAFNRAKKLSPTVYPEAISPHSMRHSKAMHLLENGVNLVYIRDFLGHSSVTTTEIYSKANPEIKRKYLEMASNNLIDHEDYNQEEKEELLEWLKKNI